MNSSRSPRLADVSSVSWISSQRSSAVRSARYAASVLGDEAALHPDRVEEPVDRARPARGAAAALGSGEDAGLDCCAHVTSGPFVARSMRAATGTGRDNPHRFGPAVNITGTSSQNAGWCADCTPRPWNCPDATPDGPGAPGPLRALRARRLLPAARARRHAGHGRAAARLAPRVDPRARTRGAGTVRPRITISGLANTARRAPAWWSRTIRATSTASLLQAVLPPRFSFVMKREAAEPAGRRDSCCIASASSSWTVTATAGASATRGA